MVCKYNSDKCKLYKRCGLYNHLGNEFRYNHCDSANNDEQECNLYQAWEENVRLKKQIADGGLEEKTKEDTEILEQRGLN
jgi:hypothetical protein